MFVAKNLIYIQLEKTACSHIAYLLSQCIEGEQVLKHNPLKEYPTDKTIIGSIRNPWDWYVSLWAYSSQGDSTIYKAITNRSIKNALKIHSGVSNPANFTSWLKQNPLKRGLSTALNSYKGLYSEWRKPVKIWQECYQDLGQVSKFRQWLKLVYDPRRTYDFGIVGYGQNSLSSFAGLMTFRYCRLYTKDFFTESNKHKPKTIDQLVDFDREFNILDEAIKVENLEFDLINAIQKANYQLKEEQYNLINQAPKTNTSKRFDVSHYYDQETADLVAEKEKFLIDKYKYLPPKI